MKTLQISEAVEENFGSLMVLYRQLQSNDPVLTNGTDYSIFRDILENPSLHLFVASLDERLVASTYLNIIPNITRSASPYAVIENVVTHEELRGTGIGKLLMHHTLEFAWNQGCYKVMLQSGSKQESVRGFYRSCGFNAHDKVGYVARPAKLI